MPFHRVVECRTREYIVFMLEGETFGPERKVRWKPRHDVIKTKEKITYLTAPSVVSAEPLQEVPDEYRS